MQGRKVGHSGMSHTQGSASCSACRPSERQLASTLCVAYQHAPPSAPPSAPPEACPTAHLDKQARMCGGLCMHLVEPHQCAARQQGGGGGGQEPPDHGGGGIKAAGGQRRRFSQAPPGMHRRVGGQGALCSGCHIAARIQGAPAQHIGTKGFSGYCRPRWAQHRAVQGPAARAQWWGQPLAATSPYPS